MCMDGYKSHVYRSQGHGTKFGKILYQNSLLILVLFVQYSECDWLTLLAV